MSKSVLTWEKLGHDFPILALSKTVFFGNISHDGTLGAIHLLLGIWDTICLAFIGRPALEETVGVYRKEVLICRSLRLALSCFNMRNWLSSELTVRVACDIYTKAVLDEPVAHLGKLRLLQRDLQVTSFEKRSCILLTLLHQLLEHLCFCAQFFDFFHLFW